MSMNSEHLIALDYEGGEQTKYYTVVRGREEWTTNRKEAKTFSSYQEAESVMREIANGKDVNICGMLHPSHLIKSGLDMGEAVKLSGRGTLQLMAVNIATVLTYPIAGRIRPA